MGLLRGSNESIKLPLTEELEGPDHSSLWRLNDGLVLWSSFITLLQLYVSLWLCICSNSQKWSITAATSQLLFTGMSFVPPVCLCFCFSLPPLSMGAFILLYTFSKRLKILANQIIKHRCLCAFSGGRFHWGQNSPWYLVVVVVYWYFRFSQVPSETKTILIRNLFFVIYECPPNENESVFNIFKYRTRRVMTEMMMMMFCW